MKEHYSKIPLSAQELIVLLESRGLIISNEQKALSYLINIGYFRLSAYFYPLLKQPKELHSYKSGSTFEKVMDIYRFDRKLRLLLFNEIEKIEVAIRSSVANNSSLDFANLFWLNDKKYFSDETKYLKTLSIIDNELHNSNEDFISHFYRTYIESYPPSWMIMEIIPLGSLIHIYMNLKDKRLKKKIARQFTLEIPVFESWLIVISGLRNICCHHGRIWNRELPISATEPRKIIYNWIDSSKTDKRRMYYRICMIRYFLFTVSPNNNFKEKLIDLFERYPNIDITAMGFPNDWEDEPLWK